MSEPTDGFVEALRRQIAGDVFADEVSRGIYSTDASIYQIFPRVVVVPRHREDVLAAVRLARVHAVPILPRGGGTSLAGQTVGAAMVIDFSKWMNRLLETNAEERWARVEPGLVRDELNSMVARHGLHFAPDPATSSRANVGGMIGNNSSGIRSLRYGKTIDHVLELVVLLADGTVLELGESAMAEFLAKTRQKGREAELLRAVFHLVEANRDEIAARFPKTMRRVGGYALDELLDEDAINPAKLLVGSEGTLGLVLEAKVRLEPLPRHTMVTVIRFDGVLPAIRAVQPILAFEPSAVEILDGTVIRLAGENVTTAALSGFLEGSPEAVLIVELIADSEAVLGERAAALTAALDGQRLGYAHSVFATAEEQQRIWEVRKSGLGLMLGLPGDRKPLPFIEDAAVPVEVLPEYVEKVLEFCRRQGVEVALYAHASVGVVHLRPILDLRQRGDVERLVAISEHAFALVRGYDGSWSSEHGDGLVRSAYNPRFFGPRIYRLLTEVKALFDPENLMNPGKIVEAPPIDESLRYGTAYRAEKVDSFFQYRTDGSFAAAVEMCSGVGACRKTLTGTMCPSFIATRDEEHSTRGRANALRLAMSGQLGSEGLVSRRVRETLDLCLSCKACKSECPSNVDVAKLKSEVFQLYYDRHGASRRERLTGRSAELSRRLAGHWWTPLFSTLAGTPLFRRALESWAGISRKRSLPPWARTRFHSSWRGGRPARDGGRRVVLFADTYLDCHEPHVGRAAAELLNACGYEVEVFAGGCCQRPRISHGFLRDARRVGERTLVELDRFFQEGIPVLVCEPSCASALSDDLPDLVEDAALARRTSEGVSMIDVFLARELEAGRLEASFSSPFERLLIHGHCHQKALFGTAAMKRVYREVPSLSVSEVDSGCCGMAGSFGFERERYELSRKIGEDRLFPALRKLGVETGVVACGTSCRQQIEHFTGRRALHWVETLQAG